MKEQIGDATQRAEKWKALATDALLVMQAFAVGEFTQKAIEAALEAESDGAMSEKDENIALRHILKAILDGLPANRDWFDPDVERVARKLTETK